MKVPPLAIVWSIAIAVASFLSPRTFAQLSTIKQIEQLQKECSDSLPQEEREILFPSKEYRRFLIDKIIASLNRDGEFMTFSERERLKDSIEKVLPESQYQDVNSYMILQGVLRDALPLCQAYDFCPPSYSPRIATLHCPAMNADARPINDEFVLFINGRFLNFFYQMIKSTIPTIGITISNDSMVNISYSKSEMIRRVRTDTLLQSRFVRQLEYALYGRKYPDYRPDKSYNPFITELTHCIELFIICHELYHASHKHDVKSQFTFSGNETYNAADMLQKKRMLVTAWSYEVLADYNAQRMLNLYAQQEERDYFIHLSKLGGLLYFVFENVYQKAMYIFQHGKLPEPYTPKDLQQIGNIVEGFTNDNASDTLLMKIEDVWTSRDHPPYELRTSIVSILVEDALSGAAKEGPEYRFFLAGKHLLAAIEALYGICEPKLIQIANQKNKHQ